MTLEAGIFHLKEDLELLLEVEEKGWKFRKSEDYQLTRVNGQGEGDYLTHGEIVTIFTRRGGKMHLIVTDTNLGFLVMQKFNISSISRITIGTHEENTICYHFQNLISGYHSFLEWRQDGFYIQDTSSNGVFCGHQKINGSRRLRFGDCINIFGLQLVYLDEMLAIGTNYGQLEIKPEELIPYEKEAWLPSTPEPGEEPRYFNRSPRNLPVILSEKIEIEAPPAPKAEVKRPLFLTIGPAFTMAIPMMLGCGMAILSSRMSGRSSGTFMFTGIITAISSAVLGVFWALMNIKYSKKEQEEEEELRFNAYGNYLIEMADRIREIYIQNEAAMHQMYPSARECCAYGEDAPQLWNRNYTHKDFLWLRLGVGDIPFQAEISVPKEKFTLKNDSLADKPGFIRNEYQILHAVPVGIDLQTKHLIGLVGGKGKKGAVSLMHVLAAQIAANNCYTDVKMAFVYDRKKEGNAALWECMKWFPHVWSEDKKTRYFASDSLEAGDVFFELANIFRRREENMNSPGKKPRVKPYYILFVSDASLLEGELIRKYIYEPREEYGFTVFLMSETCEQLPNVCENIIQNDSFFQGSYNVMENNEKRQTIAFDQVDWRNLENFGRRILKLRVNEIESNAEIPGNLDFLSMYQVHRIEELAAEERWRKSRTYNLSLIHISEPTRP